jgi:hypothetical protein
MPPAAAARRSLCPAIWPGARRATRGSATRPDPPSVERSSPSCARPATWSWRPHPGVHRAAVAGGPAHHRGAHRHRARPRAPRRVGPILVRHGKGGRRREVGMDPWGWEHRHLWLEPRMAMPVGPLLCVIDGPTRGRPWASDSARAQLRRVAAKAGVAAVRPAPGPPRPRRRARARGGPAQRHSAPIGAYQPRPHLYLSARDRQRRDHRHRPRPESADDPPPAPGLRS